MYKRTTVQERRMNKVRLYEYNHPRNKHVIYKQKLRGWKWAEARRLAHKVLTKMAEEGNTFANTMLCVMSLNIDDLYIR